MHEKIDASHVAAWPCEACDQTELDWIVPNPEDDRDRRGRSFCRERTRGEAGRGDDRHLSANQVGHEARHAVILTLHPVVLHRDVASLKEAGFTQALAEGGHVPL